MNEVKMPRLGVTMQNGTVSNWIIDEGDTIEKGDYLFELETEKSTLEIEAQTSGVLKKIIVPAGEEVPINTVIAIIANEDEEVDLSRYTESTSLIEETAATLEQIESTMDEKKPQVQNESQKGSISPRARKLAKELGVAIDDVTGTGKNGLITEDDVRKSASSANSNSSIAIKEKITLNNIQRAMSENMLDSWRNVPQFTQMVSVNMEKALNVKKTLSGISLNDMIVKAVGNAVKVTPIVNSRLEENQILVFDEVNISVAVNSKHGLVVPVIKNVENKSVTDISEEVKDLAQRAEQNQLTFDDYSNGTITVSNLGSLGIETGTPIINTPQSTLVFAGAIRKTPVVDENNEIVVAPIMTLSICYDHRYIDGVTGAQFTNEVKNTLENLTADDLL
ncbi:dehydrogenase catalytic domain-containing protein [Neobacillus bataviensis LMG 21833]|uniref:Dihydrolipoamide acetyltransferase component of pyruvate dehydrogenase complex n=1 Tax=Neobacillus bataviensis LMG 21833 TaxID=1117379 RepID=K6DS01_9BACI|nr:dihydrolipoamide acetyltransferase family protein [Neobacillus bataviensis]EKN70988.1 dehydrogenase catalytic domain-containing protein [Neobacillus bataviensis LMG 21833]